MVCAFFFLPRDNFVPGLSKAVLNQPLICTNVFPFQLWSVMLHQSFGYRCSQGLESAAFLLVTLGCCKHVSPPSPFQSLGTVLTILAWTAGMTRHLFFTEEYVCINGWPMYTGEDNNSDRWIKYAGKMRAPQFGEGEERWVILDAIFISGPISHILS